MDIEVKVVNVLDVRPHPDADRLDIALIHGFECVIAKNSFQPGDPAVYFPDAAILPDTTLRDLGLWDEQKGIGKLAGPWGNRIHPIRLRDVLSQGLLVKPPAGANPGDDMAEHYGVTKWVPEIPTEMQGDLVNIPVRRPEYDIQDYLRWPGIIRDGDRVVYTEKLHGTHAAYTCVPGLDHPGLYHGNTIIGSKGIVQHASFEYSPDNDGAIYVRAFREHLAETGIWDRVEDFATQLGEPVTVFGEIFGVGVQDLHYGMETKGHPGFRAFDVHTGDPREGAYLEFQTMKALCEDRFGIPVVPVLYDGPHSETFLQAFTQGKDTISGTHVREGVVITASPERCHPELGRVKLKSKNPAYLFRRGNRTEYH